MDLDDIPDESQKALQDGFSKYYIDPHRFVKKAANRIMQDMTKYCQASEDTYIAPYTSLVTSSMMGKTRLMKELTKHLPVVYLCLRNRTSSGYPSTTPKVVEWIQEGTCGSLGVSSNAVHDRDFILPSLKFSMFLLSLFKHLTRLLVDVNLLQSLGVKLVKDNFEWMWQFFAEESDAVTEFWTRVTADATTQLRSHPSRKFALQYLRVSFVRDLQIAYEDLEIAFRPYLSGTFTLLLCFDEARTLCQFSAFDGSRISETDDIYDEAVHRNAGEVVLPFSNFRALRRALRFLLQAEGSRAMKSNEESEKRGGVALKISKGFPVPRVFGLFTDTTSRLANFQPRASEDRSMRILRLPFPGKVQFEPLHVFTSVDAHAQMIVENKCISDVNEVANAERLLKFGRAGWYSVYAGKDTSNKQIYDHNRIVDLAVCKLLGVPVVNRVKVRGLFPSSHPQLTPKSLLRLLAVLAPRLALTVGPYTVEAEELISSHLAVLIRTDTDRHFLRTAYPSEPIVAEASAYITSNIGWGLPLKALHHYVHTGIVGAGFRGELLSKILCLMAMDSTPKSLPLDRHWNHSQPVKVSCFLDHLLTAPDGKASFSEALDAKALQVDSDELRRFLDGYVFFNHFIRLEVKLSLELIIASWNRGAAIMPVEGTHRFDHVIPVMLAPADGSTTFGPLYKEWSGEEKRRACPHVSFILINSKNEFHPKGKVTQAKDIYPVHANLEDCSMFTGGDPIHAGTDDTPKSVYLSILQVFGPRLMRPKENPVNIILPGHRTGGRSPRKSRRQIVVVLKGLSQETYKCIQDLEDTNSTLMQVENSGRDGRKDVESEARAQGDHPMPDHALEDTEMKVHHAEEADMKYSGSEDDEIKKPSGSDALEGEEEEEFQEEELEGDELEEGESEDEEDEVFDESDDPLKGDRKITRTYLRLLNDARFRYLEGMENNDHRVGVKESLPVVLGKWDQEAYRDWEDEQTLRELSERNDGSPSL
jgi:hypothetical protein